MWTVPGRAVAAALVLVTALERSGVTHLYTEYWTCNRLAFASRERLTCAVLENDLRPGLDRYRPYRDAVDAHPHPAYVFPIGTAIERAFASRLAASGIRARIDEVGGYRVYHPARRPM